MSAYYNEIDPYAAQWLRNLIAAGHIAPGEVDERTIVDVRPGDLASYTQCHFFAGIGGWSDALRLAGWPDDRPVWTGSCPCQPFSSAGAGKAADDERHLWPAWLPLIAECRPAIVFGEQVEAAIGWGWLDAVFADLEGEGYACGAAILPACGVGAPHIRARAWFVADAGGGRYEPLAGGVPEIPRQSPALGHNDIQLGGRGTTRELADAARRDQRRHGRDARGAASARGSEARDGADQLSSRPSGLAHWSDADWLPCRDGKARPVEPGTFPLAHGIPGRVGRLRAYGNAIVPQVAAEFISAYLDATEIREAA